MEWERPQAAMAQPRHRDGERQKVAAPLTGTVRGEVGQVACGSGWPVRRLCMSKCRRDTTAARSTQACGKRYVASAT